MTVEFPYEIGDIIIGYDRSWKIVVGGEILGFLCTNDKRFAKVVINESRHNGKTHYIDLYTFELMYHKVKGENK